MKVLVAHNRYRSALPSGENAVVDQEVSQLRAAGLDVRAVLPSSDDIPALPAARKIGVALGPVSDPWAVRELAALIDSFRPDVLHLHNVFPQISPWSVRTAHRRGVPVVQTVHNYRHSCISGFRFRAGGPCDSCVGRRLPLPAVRHACYRGSHLQSFAMATGQVLHRGTWLSVDHFLALTPFMAGQLTALGVPAGRISIRPTAVPDPGPPGPPGIDVVFVGRLDEMKGADLLLSGWEAARPPAGSRLRVVGDGPLLQELRHRGEQIPGVDVLGPLGPDGVASAMRAAALIAIPSLWYEGQPRVLAEAFAHGRPVLATDLGGLAGLDAQGVGWSVPPTTEAFARALQVLHDPHRLRTAATRARQAYEEHHSAERALESLLHVYDRLARHPVRTRR